MESPRPLPESEGQPAERRASEARVVVERGEIPESVHRIHAVVAGETGPSALFGTGGQLTTLRSAAKLFQALPLVEDGAADALGLTRGELALCCASHNSEPRHLAGARSILRKAGLDEEALVCGGHRPLDEGVARTLDRSGVEPGPIHNNCSGKHAGMLALALHHGWSPVGYHRPDHPVQRRMAREVARWSGLSAGELPRGIDGCGIPCWALPLERVATAFRGFGVAARSRWDEGSGAARIVQAIAAEPMMIGGRNRLCSALPEVTGGRIVAKIGAEGVYGAMIPEEGIGIALKVEDGAHRAVEPALIGVLEALDALTREERSRLAPFRTVPLRNTRRETVGRIRFVAAEGTG